jgi:hypothetical protein
LSIGNFSNESYFLVFERRNCWIAYKKIPRKMGRHRNFGEKGSSFYNLNMQSENNFIESTCVLVV